MRAFLPLLLVLASVAAYFTLALGFGVYQRIPWPHLLVAVAACAWALRMVVVIRRPAPIISAALCLLLTVGYGWYALDYSVYAGEAGVAKGEKIAALGALELSTHREGETSPVLAGEPSRATLLVLYRGFW